MTAELFELELLGGTFERRYRRLRPNVEAMPWGTLRATKLPPLLVGQARAVWTRMAFHEHRTAAACAAVVEALIAARAPLDLAAVCSGFVLDELAHTELCARVAEELGGGVPLSHEPLALYPPAKGGISPLLRASDFVIRVFCVGEAFSVPMAQEVARLSTEPLIAAVHRRIARDEAAHGKLGWEFFDWAAPRLSDGDRAHLGMLAQTAIAALERSWEKLAPGEVALGWLTATQFRARAKRALDEDVRGPLRARGLLPT